jgi:hypothetical protein
MCFSLCQEANFWDASGVGQVKDGHVVTWRKMTSINTFMEALKFPIKISKLVLPVP